MSTTQIIDSQALSAHIGIPTKTLAEWRSRSEGPPYMRIGRHVRYSMSDVEKWLASRPGQAQAVVVASPISSRERIEKLERDLEVLTARVNERFGKDTP